ncbi:unnamed protein product, partial [Sphagnum balticum]
AESEKERESVMNNGWLADKIGFMINHYITLMQPVAETSHAEKSSADGSHETVKSSPRTKSPKSDRAKSPKSKSPTGSKKQSQGAVSVPPPPPTSKKGKKTPEAVDENAKNKDTKKPKKPSKNEEASPPPPEDLDEKLIHDAYRAATNHVTQIVTSEVSLMSADDVPKEEPVADAKDAKGGKAKKSGSPGGGKKGKEAAPTKAKSPKGGKKGKGEVVEAAPTVAVELSEEEKAKKELKDKMKKEYLAALKKEASSGPFPFPTQTQLLELLHKYKAADRENSHLIDKNTFLKIPLWFTLEKPSTPVDITKPHSYDRHANLVTFWFSLFAVNVPTLPDLTGQKSSIAGPVVQKLDYKSMLLYMAAVSDPYDGFLRALAVSQEKPVPKLEPRIHMKSSSFNTYKFYLSLVFL